MLRTLLQESLARLDHLKGSYSAFQQRMISELARYPVAVSSTVSDYDVKLCKYFKVERKPPKVKACLLTQQVEGSPPVPAYFLMHNIYLGVSALQSQRVLLWLSLLMCTFCELCVCVCPSCAWPYYAV